MFTTPTSESNRCYSLISPTKKTTLYRWCNELFTEALVIMKVFYNSQVSEIKEEIISEIDDDDI